MQLSSNLYIKKLITILFIFLKFITYFIIEFDLKKNVIYSYKENKEFKLF